MPTSTISIKAQFVALQNILFTSTFQLLPYFFSNPTHKTETGFGKWAGRLLIATHLDQSNHLPNQRQGIVNKYINLTVFVRLFQGALWKLCAFSSGSQQSFSSSGFTGFDWWTWLMNLIQDFRVTYSTLVGDVSSTDEPHLRFQGHILNIDGDAP
jgi:hypothetical protein